MGRSNCANLSILYSSGSRQSHYDRREFICRFMRWAGHGKVNSIRASWHPPRDNDAVALGWVTARTLLKLAKNLGLERYSLVSGLAAVTLSSLWLIIRQQHNRQNRFAWRSVRPVYTAGLVPYVSCRIKPLLYFTSSYNLRLCGIYWHLTPKTT